MAEQSSLRKQNHAKAKATVVVVADVDEEEIETLAEAEAEDFQEGINLPELQKK
jgi:predicted Zn-dependent peptidase